MPDNLRWDPVRRVHVHEPKSKEFILELWAYLSVDPSDNTEGVISSTVPHPVTGQTMLMPLVGADEDRMRSLLPIARRIKAASSAKNPIRLVKFTHRVDVETF